MAHSRRRASTSVRRIRGVRIDKGVESGQLNQKEAARLEKGQEHVQKMEDRALKDGKVTKQEKRNIEHAQDVQSKRIARQKHDKQKAKPKPKAE